MSREDVRAALARRDKELTIDMAPVTYGLEQSKAWVEGYRFALIQIGVDLDIGDQP